MNASVSEKLPSMARLRMKSKGVVQVQSFSRSSSSNLQFGGTLYYPFLAYSNFCSEVKCGKTNSEGWMGLRSTPTTCRTTLLARPACWKQHVSSYLGLGVSIGVVNGPIPVPGPHVENPLGAVGFGAESKLAAKGQQPRVVLDL